MPGWFGMFMTVLRVWGLPGGGFGNFYIFLQKSEKIFQKGLDNGKRCATFCVHSFDLRLRYCGRNYPE